MAGVAVLKTKGTDKGKSTVWIGFMDIVPVIGAVKESVEFVLALYEGNSEEIKEKEKALDDIVMQLTQSGYKAAAAAADTTKCYNVKEVSKGKITKHVNKASKNQNLTSAEKGARMRKLDEIRRGVEEKLSKIGRLMPGELTEQLTRARKGEHVFNNNILKFHSNVVHDFIVKSKIHLLRGYESKEQTLKELGKHTLSPQTEADIQTNMVVDFEPHEFYVNANAILYGCFSKVLREAFVKVLCEPFVKVLHFPDPSKETNKQWVTFIIECMNYYEIYVDEFAKEKWINKKQKQKMRFLEVRGEVAHMYRTGRGLTWCAEIICEVEPLFDGRQFMVARS
ncbi:hypothetical protein Q7C36_018671 [Tachysurus vachellii]|uniref:Uncharacterized protein n=1 Tax=Tachysurus vachellii TaxID=175792 RepID=A0AA88M006_TACVA|nr:hypothetical protein Q7C36_018671 [Tachysurus vachellii]